MQCFWYIDMLSDGTGRQPEMREVSGGTYTVLSVDRTKNFQLDQPFLLLLKTTGKHKRRRIGIYSQACLIFSSTKDLNILEVFNLGEDVMWDLVTAGSDPYITQSHLSCSGWQSPSLMKSEHRLYVVDCFPVGTVALWLPSWDCCSADRP